MSPSAAEHGISSREENERETSINLHCSVSQISHDVMSISDTFHGVEMEF